MAYDLNGDGSRAMYSQSPSSGAASCLAKDVSAVDYGAAKGVGATYVLL